MTDKGSRFALRELTRDDHETLDALVGEFTDKNAYLRYLEGMAAFRGGVERRLAEVDYPETFGGWRPGLISTELEQDLRDLGREAPRAPVPFDLPADRDALLGVLYVLEGSSLGARLLVRRAAELGLTSARAARMTFAAAIDAFSGTGYRERPC